MILWIHVSYSHIAAFYNQPLYFFIMIKKIILSPDVLKLTQKSDLFEIVYVSRPTIGMLKENLRPTDRIFSSRI